MVKPLVRVVDSVFTPLVTTGVANPLRSGATALRPARPRSPWARFKANLREAIEELWCEGRWDGEVGRGLELKMEFVRLCFSTNVEAWVVGQ